MLTIKRHGVKLYPNKLSTTQNLIADSQTAPILVIGAPTGAGKTWGFQKLIANQQAVVLFIVPTQALAQNICESMEKESLYAKRWDSFQTQDAKAQGQSTWTDRLLSLKVEARKRGGMIVATLEAFHGITLGWPDRAEVNLRVRDILDHVDYLVFDEAHLLNERAFGFIALWATLIAYWRMQCGGRTRMALLSATHSNLVDFLVKNEEDSMIGLPAEWVARCDETIVAVEAGENPPDVRIIHGDVTVELHQGSIEELIPTLIPALLDCHERVLVVHDSLAALGLNEARLKRIANSAGLTVGQVFSANSQDKYLEKSAGSAGFDAGHEIKPEHRLIVGTSAIEVGLNLAGATALITDQARNAGALLQRIGRAARGDKPGEVHVVYRQKAPHIIRLEKLSGSKNIAETTQALEPLIQFDKRQAQILGSAYLSMLSRYNYHLNKALDQVLAAIKAAEGSQPLAKKSLLNAAYHEFRELQKKKPGYRYLATFKQWLEAIDQALQDLRGFTPTVKIRFANTPAFPCSLDFVQKQLPLPDDYDGDVLVYNGPRDAYLKDKPDPIDVQVLTPFGRETLAGIRGEEALRECYRATISNHRNASAPELDAAVKFAQRSGLVPRVRLSDANTEKEGTLVW